MYFSSYRSFHCSFRAVADAAGTAGAANSGVADFD